MLIDRRCVSCGGRGDVLCAGCVATLLPAPRLAPPAGVDTFDALFRYEGAGRELILALKYRNARGALGRLGRAMAAAIAHERVGGVTFAPTTASRRRARGYDQAELLARSVAHRAGAPFLRLLDRSPGQAQTGLTRRDRLEGPSFVARRPHHGALVVVDDVCTTGATLAAAAAALRSGGAGPIHAVTLAVTPAAPRTCSLKTAAPAAEDGLGGVVDPHEKRKTDAAD